MDELVSTVASLSLVIITAYYAWVTRRILRANERLVASMVDQVDVMRDQLAEVRSQGVAIWRPYISVGPFVVRGSRTIYLRVKNHGKTAACDVRLKLDKDFATMGKLGRSLSGYSAFANPIESLGADSQLVFSLGVDSQIFCEEPGHDHGMPTVFSVSADYCFGDLRYSDVFVVDLKQFYRTVPDSDPVVDQLKRIATSVEKGCKS